MIVEIMCNFDFDFFFFSRDLQMYYRHVFD